MYIKEITEVDKLIFSENPPKKPNYKNAKKYNAKMKWCGFKMKNEGTKRAQQCQI